ncbi:MAG: RNA polymerase sigma factor [Eggerthellaceae bacterium]|nr:RNA polymerase sigma factor [Eggerthellaceae bacterium]
MMRTEAERLVCAYSDLILRLSYTYLGSVQDAEDICQNVLIKLMTLSPEFSSFEHEKAWVIRVTANACKDLLRTAARRRSVGLEALGSETPAKVEPDALFLDDTPVACAVAALPIEQREAVHLHYYEGYQIAEIARMTGASPAAVAKRLSRARETLREILGRKHHG